jgi:transcriptional regulator with XRE-family HTH domain
MDIETQRLQRAKELRLMRKLSGLTQEGLSSVSGVRQATISKIETGKVSWNIDTELLLTIAIQRFLNPTL